MMALAAIPSASVALVVVRSGAYGVKDGAAVAAGIVVGDLIFVALALLGMSAAAATFGGFFAVIRYIGGAYLIWIGIKLIRSKRSIQFQSTAAETQRSSLFTSFASGLLLTLGDVKAIVFYASLFPIFIDIPRVGFVEVCLIGLITIVTVGGVKFAYAVAARRIMSRMSSPQSQKHARTAAGTLLIGAGAYVVTKS